MCSSDLNNLTRLRQGFVGQALQSAPVRQERNDDTNLLCVMGCVSRDTTSEFELENKKYTVNLPGKFNVYNALAAIAVGK